MIETVSTAKCDRCGRFHMWRAASICEDDVWAVLDREGFEAFSDTGIQIFSDLPAVSRVLCANCADGFRSARGALLEDYAGGAE